MNRIRYYRKEMGLTMKKLGEMVGMAESTISLYETGKREPDLETLSRLADILGVSVDALLGREEKAPADPGLNEYLIHYLTTLSPERERFVLDFLQLPEDQSQRVMDFLAGLKAGRQG